MKRIVSVLIALMLAATSLLISACSGESQVQKLCANPWASSTDVLEFTENGRILWNFEGLLDSVSYYKLLKNNKINMYTEEGEEYGIILDYRFEGERLFIGEVEYTPLPTDEELGNIDSELPQDDSQSDNKTQPQPDKNTAQ